MGGLLIAHYDRRVKKARDRADSLVQWIRVNAYIDMYSTMGETKLISSEKKDAPERYFFFDGIAISMLAVALASR